MAVDYVALLKTAEMTYRLAHAVRAECAIHVLHGEEAHFDYPQIYTYGKHKVILGEFALTGQQESLASAALLHSATYTMAIQMDRVLQEVVGSDRFKHPDSDISSASWIARLIRNAFAHSPFNPTWQTYPECDKKVFRDITIFTQKALAICTANGYNSGEVLCCRR